MKKKNLYFVITIIFCLFHINELEADKSDIPLCYNTPEVFDKNLVSYEEYILEKCFSFFNEHIEKGEYLSKKEFLNKIKNDKAFERFIYLYVLIKEYWHAQNGTLVDLDYTMNFDKSLFKNYLIWGAENGNYYARLIQAIEWQTYSVDEEILKLIKDNKHSLLWTFDMGMETFLENQDAFFNKFSVNDFETLASKRLYLEERSKYESALDNKKDPEKHIATIKNYSTDLPTGFFSAHELSAFKDTALISLYANNYAKANDYISGLFDYISLDKNEFPDLLKKANVSTSYFDAFNYICDAMSYIFITEAYFNDGFDIDNELNNIIKIYESCFKSEESKYTVEGEKIWWGLIASWYEKYDKAYDLLLPSKYPKHFGATYAKSSDILVPSFFNYAAIASLEKGKYDQAEEFLYHAQDAYEKNERDNNFQMLFSDFIKIKIIDARGKHYQAHLLLNEMRQIILDYQVDFGNGYFTDEDIDIFINQFLDLTFSLKEIDEDFFVDPLFLFELKNIIFQSDNLLNLRKNSDESEYNKLLVKYQDLNDEKTYIENQIFNSNNSEAFKLSNKLEEIENNIYEIRTRILDLKKSLRIFYGASESSYLDLKNRITSDDIILFNNFSISGSRTVKATKNEITLIKSKHGRNKVRNLISKIRKSLELNNGQSLQDLTEYDFDSAKKLYDVLFKNINIDNYKNIYTFSNEILNSIPLQILISDFDETKIGWDKYYSANWLNKEYSFAVLETLVKNQDRKDYKKSFMGFGDPDLSNDPLFNDIPNTKQELIDIALASGAKPNDLYMRGNANLTNFVNVLESKSERVVIASHAFAPFSINDTIESGIVLSSDEKNSSFITASEIALLDIESDWVVLSACDTGFNELDYSKNYSSLAKAFLAAGVNSVLISNWSIETKSSALITKEVFNTVWYDPNATKHMALKQASEKLRNDLSKNYYIHPAFWGSFSIVYDSI